MFLKKLIQGNLPQKKTVASVLAEFDNLMADLSFVQAQALDEAEAHAGTAEWERQRSVEAMNEANAALCIAERLAIVLAPVEVEVEAQAMEEVAA